MRKWAQSMKKSLTNDLQRCLAAEMSDTYISHFLQVDVAVVQKARLGDFPPEPEPYSKPRVRKRRSRPTPAIRPFPVIEDDTPDKKRIIVLTNHGLSARKIQKYLRGRWSTREISDYATKVLGPPRTGNSSIENQIGPRLMPLIHACLAHIGKNRYRCEICLEPVPKGCQVHHTRYEGATLYDLMYVCQSCNCARENKGLA